MPTKDEYKTNVLNALQKHLNIQYNLEEMIKFFTSETLAITVNGKPVIQWLLELANLEEDESLLKLMASTLTKIDLHTPIDSVDGTTLGWWLMRGENNFDANDSNPPGWRVLDFNPMLYRTTDWNFAPTRGPLAGYTAASFLINSYSAIEFLYSLDESDPLLDQINLNTKVYGTSRSLAWQLLDEHTEVYIQHPRLVSKINVNEFEVIDNIDIDYSNNDEDESLSLRTFYDGLESFEIQQDKIATLLVELDDFQIVKHMSDPIGNSVDCTALCELISKRPDTYLKIKDDGPAIREQYSFNRAIFLPEIGYTLDEGEKLELWELPGDTAGFRFTLTDEGKAYFSSNLEELRNLRIEGVFVDWLFFTDEGCNFLTSNLDVFFDSTQQKFIFANEELERVLKNFDKIADESVKELCSFIWLNHILDGKSSTSTNDLKPPPEKDILEKFKHNLWQPEVLAAFATIHRNLFTELQVELSQYLIPYKSEAVFVYLLKKATFEQATKLSCIIAIGSVDFYQKQHQPLTEQQRKTILVTIVKCLANAYEANLLNPGEIPLPFRQVLKQNIGACTEFTKEAIDEAIKKSIQEYQEQKADKKPQLQFFKRKLDEDRPTDKDRPTDETSPHKHRKLDFRAP